jgi:hypothetical protein
MVNALLGVQLITVMFAIFMMYVAFWHYKQSNIGAQEIVFWIFIWLVFIYFAIFPRVLDPILAKLYIARAFDLLTVVAFMILAYLGFQNHVGIKDLQRRIEQLVRANAVKNVKRIR